MNNDVQLENGYTRVANELLEVIYSTNFNATQLKIILCVIRYTYGFNRKSHNISVNFFSKATGISKRYIIDELNKLVVTKVLTVIKEHTNTMSRILRLNKDYSQWVGYRTILNQMNTTSPDEQYITTTDEQYFTTTDEQYFIQERKKEKLKESSTKKNYDDFFEEVWKLYPNKKAKSAVSEKSKGAIHKIGIGKMKISIDNYKTELKKETWKQPMNGSTFFNGRYEDYLPVAAVKEGVAVSKGKIILFSDEDIAVMNNELNDRSKQVNTDNNITYV